MIQIMCIQMWMNVRLEAIVLVVSAPIQWAATPVHAHLDLT